MKLTQQQIGQLEIGDKVHLYYAKDDSPEDVRCNEVHIVLDWEGDNILTQVENGDGYLWEWKIDKTDDDSICVDTTRGYAYFTEVNQ